MSRHTLTRRSFLAGTAGAAGAAALVGSAGYGAWERAFADDGADDAARAVHTLCDGCSKECGFTAYVINGKVGKIIADADNPVSGGRLCARGYAMPQIVDSKDRLTDPLKRNDKGQFDAISWDQALQEIGDKVKEIVSQKGPEALAFVEDPRPSADWYGRRFMNALGSANVYAFGVAASGAPEAAVAQVTGTNCWQSDVANSKMTLYFGRSYADGQTPAELAALERGHFENGSRIVFVDPRFDGAQKLADEWVPIKPGTELAFVLAMCNFVVENGRYDKSFVRDNGYGFADFARKVKDYTPAWAADICGVDAGKISALAAQMANAAPACSIAVDWQGPACSEYKNSGEFVRAVTVFNGLMGCYNQKGGALILPRPAFGKLDEKKFLPVPAPQKALAGSDAYPLSAGVGGSFAHALELAGKGELAGMFFYGTNLTGTCMNSSYVGQCLDNLALSVCIDVEMSETASHCSYVLPETSYLERSELPACNAAFVPAVSMRTQVIGQLNPNTKAPDEIFSGLASACGVGQYFQFSLDELATAQLKTLGIGLDEARRVGTVSLPDKRFHYGARPSWGTPTGKFQFSSDACRAAGYEAVPSWVEPEVTPQDESLRLIDGPQFGGHDMAANNESLMSLTKKYELTRLWMNSGDAAERGISEGDTVEVANGIGTGKIACHVTDRIVSGAVYLPGGYGVTVEDQHTANGVGLRATDFLETHLEPGYGAPEIHEILVTVKKVSA